MDISIKARHKKDFQGTMRIAADYLSKADLGALWQQETAQIKNWCKKKGIEFDAYNDFEAFKVDFQEIIDKLRFWSKD